MMFSCEMQQNVRSNKKFYKMCQVYFVLLQVLLFILSLNFPLGISVAVSMQVELR